MKNIYFFDSVVKMPLMSLPVKTVLIKTEKESILISPGSQLQQSDFQKMGPVDHLVAPNLFHTAGMKKAQDFFPKAKTWGVYRSSYSPIDNEHWPFSDEIKMIKIQGIPRVNEIVFIHRPTKTLILTDLCFNLQNPKGLGAWFILNMFGTYKKFAVSRFFLKAVRDKNKFEESLKEILNEDFNKIVMSHGDMIEENAKEKFKQAFIEKGYLI